MRKLLNKISAVASACVLSVCSIGFPTVNAETQEIPTITISFDYTADGGSTLTEQAFPPIQTKANMPLNIPTAGLARDGYYFTGWTYDNIHAYTPNDVFYSPTGSDITLEPIWTEKGAETHSIEYVVEIDGEIQDTSEKLPTRKLAQGQVVQVPYTAFTRDDATQNGWELEETAFRGGEKFIVPDHDITLVPHWCMNYHITYIAGDVQGINGATFIDLICPETIKTSLANTNRFSRTGYKLTGWTDDDGVEYAPLQTGYVMPSHDVTFTAVWTPVNYTIVFKQNTNSSDNIKLQGETDTTIILPEPTITQDGYYFAGWQKDDLIYYPGEEYTIEGAMPGLGISPFSAVWVRGEEPATVTRVSRVTTEKVTTTTIRTTTTTTTAKAPEISKKCGDANCDGNVTIADAVLILQSIANPDKYKLTEQGRTNADVVGDSDGVTANDALIIQQVESGKYKAEDLPLKSE